MTRQSARTSDRSCPLLPLFSLLLATSLCRPALAGESSTGHTPYQVPGADLAAVVELPRSPVRRLSPGGHFLLELIRPGAEPLADLARPERPLAGMRLDPDRPGPSRLVSYPEFTVREVATGQALIFPHLPEGARIGHAAWSPDGQRLAFALVLPERWQLALLDCATGGLDLPDTPDLNTVFGNPVVWLPDSRSLLVRTVTQGGELPAEGPLPGPRILETDGRKAPGRTWPYLLKTDSDEQEFTRLASSRLLRVEDQGRSWTARALDLDPGVYTSCRPSPDGRLLLLEELRPPWSRVRPWDDFPVRISVHDAGGRLQVVVTERPLADQVPLSHGSCVTGPRNVDWRPDADATLHWAEALDGGDAGAEAPLRDALKLWPAPFAADPVILHRTAFRYAGVSWGGPDLAIVWSRWWPERLLRSERIRPGEPKRPAEILHERNWQDRYGDPGQPLLEHDGRGGRRLLRSPDGDSLYFSGRGAAPEGERPFLDARSLDGGTRRLFQSPAGRYDNPVEYRPDTGHLLLNRESRTSPPDLWSLNLADGSERRLTATPHPHPWLDLASKEVIHYTRADGVALHGTLWLPHGWTRDQGSVPTLLWAYPNEFRSADTAGQVGGSPDRFEQLSWASPVIWLLQGYAVLDDPSMPIVGEGEGRPNDTFVEQLAGNARAAIDELVRRGVGDPRRVAVGGHSYGAFMSANLLAHTDLFAAGLAFSGAYNRTLTPFGFQSEDRSFWQAPDVYMAMSPLAHADGIAEPLLLVHGELDPNAGTHLQQSERLYEALKGLGGHARLVVLPWEGHGYRARENQLHLLWEMERWLGLHTGTSRDPGPSGP